MGSVIRAHLGQQSEGQEPTEERGHLLNNGEI